MSFYVGQKVVCVDDNPTDGWILSDFGKIESGAVYVVAWCGDWEFGLDGVLLSVLLIGIQREQGAPWGAYRFRALDELKAESRERYYKEHPELQPV